MSLCQISENREDQSCYFIKIKEIFFCFYRTINWPFARGRSRIRGPNGDQKILTKLSNSVFWYVVLFSKSINLALSKSNFDLRAHINVWFHNLSNLIFKMNDTKTPTVFDFLSWINFAHLKKLNLNFGNRIGVELRNLFKCLEL